MVIMKCLYNMKLPGVCRHILLREKEGNLLQNQTAVRQLSQEEVHLKQIK